MYKSVVGNRRLKWCEIGAKERSRIEESRMSEEAPRSLVSPRHGVYAHRLLHKASLVGAVRRYEHDFLRSCTSRISNFLNQSSAALSIFL